MSFQVSCYCGCYYRGDVCPRCLLPAMPPVATAAGLATEASTDTRRMDDTGFCPGGRL
jgi:hypothetical protein